MSNPINTEKLISLDFQSKTRSSRLPPTPKTNLLHIGLDDNTSLDLNQIHGMGGEYFELCSGVDRVAFSPKEARAIVEKLRVALEALKQP